ncbi:MAG: hypothetical protein H0U95_12475 [Bacteroidetes bacterium]|nr:hypothetical protein [Bacteroidota bacterium]
MKNLFKIIILSCLFLYSGYSLAQGEKDKVEAIRVNFISEQLKLTTNESEKFWPVYNEYMDKVKAVRKNLRQSYKKAPEELSDKEAEELYQLDLKSKQTEAELYKQYSEKIKVIIGAKKIVKLREAEEEFKRKVMKAIKDKDD